MSLFRRRKPQISTTAQQPADPFPLSTADDAERAAVLSDGVPARLRPRLVPVSSVPEDKGYLVFLASVDLALLICAAGPRWSHPVRFADAERWGVSPDDLRRLAMAGLQEEPLQNLPGVTTATGNPMHVFKCESWPVAPNVLLMERMLTGKAPNGALVGLPHQNYLWFIELRDARDFAALKFLSGLNRELCEEPGALSRGIYWWTGTRPLDRLEFEIRGDDVAMGVPGGLEPLYERLAAAGR